jgi:hypothetical protein
MRPEAGKAGWLLLASLSAVALLAAPGCGGSDEPDAPSSDDAAPDAAAFPQPDGRTLEQIAAAEGSESDLVVAPASQVFHEGTNRFGFGVFTVDREAVGDAEVAIYASRPNKPAVGPFPAAVETLEPDAAFRSESTATDPDAAKVVYRADIELEHKGEWRMLALINDGGSYAYAVVPSAVVGAYPKVPQEGEKAPVVNTPTSDDVGGDLTKIDTRQPPSTMHEEDFADVAGSKPVVLLFATPALCASRVCGPVVDIAEEVKSERGDEAAFILQEIYADNVVDKGLRPQVKAYKLPSEPWLFVIDDQGKVSTAIEGAFSEGELNAALDEVTSS